MKLKVFLKNGVMFELDLGPAPFDFNQFAINARSLGFLNTSAVHIPYDFIGALAYGDQGLQVQSGAPQGMMQ